VNFLCFAITKCLSEITENAIKSDSETNFILADVRLRLLKKDKRLRRPQTKQVTCSRFPSLETLSFKFDGIGAPRIVAAESLMPRWRATLTAVVIVAVAVSPNMHRTPYCSRNTYRHTRTQKNPAAIFQIFLGSQTSQKSILKNRRRLLSSLMVLVSDSWCKANNNLSVTSPLVNNERMMPGHWLGLVFCAYFYIPTLTAGFSETAKKQPAIRGTKRCCFLVKNATLNIRHVQTVVYYNWIISQSQRWSANTLQ